MHTRPFPLTILMNLGHMTRGSAALTMPSKFHRLANRIASCKLAARLSPTSDVPASVRNKTGIEGCLKDSIRHTSGLNEENTILRLFEWSYTTCKTVSTNEFSSTAY